MLFDIDMVSSDYTLKQLSLPKIESPEDGHHKVNTLYKAGKDFVLILFFSGQNLFLRYFL